jgi:CheY-like chemotaxis protein
MHHEGGSLAVAEPMIAGPVPTGRRREPSRGAADAEESAPEIDRRRSRPVVLLVDDLEDQRELYRQYLHFAGYDVAVARDGYEAVDRALRLRPDVVIMDLSMPGVDGFETTQRLKVLEATRRIPVIALTAYGSLPREWALAAGCAAYVRKPCYPNELADQISAVLESEEARRSPAASPHPASGPLRAHVMVVGGLVAERELYAEYLEYRGCTVSVSLDAARAVLDAQRFRPRVVVLDLDAPRLAGWNALRDLRRDPATRDVPVIGLVRSVGEAEREHARTLHADLQEKPCEPEKLYAAVKRAIAPRREAD